MRRPSQRIAAGLALALVALLATWRGAHAQLRESEWLPPGSATGGELLTRPRETLATTEDRADHLVELGRLAFRSPEILGGNARRAGLSCNACHINGHVNARFFIAGLSDRPGRIDVTHTFWNRDAEDFTDNPLEIPSLRDVARKGSFGQAGRFASLRDFTRHVIVTEFGSDDPPPAVFDALIAYQSRLGMRDPGMTETVPVTLAGDLDDLRRHLATLRRAIAGGDGPLAELVARMIRGELARIHERFHLPGHGTARQILTDWSQSLKEIGRAAETGERVTASRALDALSQRIDQGEPWLEFASLSSLYSAEAIRFLSPVTKQVGPGPSTPAP